jgi:hypothetical protein
MVLRYTHVPEDEEGCWSPRPWIKVITKSKRSLVVYELAWIGTAFPEEEEEPEEEDDEEGEDWEEG